jgi:hypothetical protein
MRPPTELRLAIWILFIKPRTLHYCHAAAKRTRVQLDHVVPTVLHTCQESRSVGMKIYALGQPATRLQYLSSELDTLLWIYYNGPRTFHLDAENFLHGNTDFRVHNLGISVRCWNRIVSKHSEFNEL